MLQLGVASGTVSTLECLCVIEFQLYPELPDHVLKQIEEEQQQERREKERQEWEKNLCKVSTCIAVVTLSP